MSRPPIREVPLSCDGLDMHLCHRDANHKEGFWLYDTDAGMNLAMGAPSEIAALVEAVQYWKKRAMTSEKHHATLVKQVNDFVSQVSPPDEA